MSVHTGDNPLKLLKAESELTLQKVQHALETYLEDPDELESLGSMAHLSDQIRGVFAMLEQPEAASFMAEVKALTQSLERGEITDAERARETLSRAVLQAPRYFNWLQWEGKKPPFNLDPLTKQLRIARTLTVVGDQSAPVAKGKDKKSSLQDEAKRLRPVLQRSLLGILRGRSRTQSLIQIAKVFSLLKQASPSESIYRFWWLAEGFIACVRGNESAPNQRINVLLRDLDREVKLLTENAEVDYRDDNVVRDISQRLADYLVSMGTSLPELEQHLAYQPPKPIAVVASPSETGGGPSLLDIETLLLIADHIRDSMALIKDAVDRFARDSGRRLDVLEAQLERMHDAANILILLNMNVSAGLVQRHLAMFKDWISGEYSVSEEQILQLASELILVEESLDGMGEFAYSQEMAASVAADLDDSGKIQLLMDYQHRRARVLIVLVSLKSIRQARDFVIEHVDRHDKAVAWQDIEPVLQRIGSVLAMLECEQAKGLVWRLQDVVQALAMGGETKDFSIFITCFAEVIVALEKYLELLSEGRTVKTDTLDHAENRLSVLEELFIAAETVILQEPEPEVEVAAEIAAEEPEPEVEVAAEIAAEEPVPEHEAEEAVEIAAEEPEPEVEVAAEIAAEEPVPEHEAEEAVEIAAEEPEPEPELEVAAEIAVEEPVPESEAEETAEEPALEPELEVTAEVAAAEPTPEPQPEAAEEPVLVLHPAMASVANAAHVDPEFLEVFFEEAQGELLNIDEQLTAWRDNLANQDALTSIRRSFHTLKGSGRMVGVAVLGEFAWSYEQLLNRVIDGLVVVSPPLLDAIGQARAVLAPLVDENREPDQSEIAVMSALMFHIEALMRDETPEEPVLPGNVAESVPETTAQATLSMHEIGADIGEEIRVLPEVEAPIQELPAEELQELPLEGLSEETWLEEVQIPAAEQPEEEALGQETTPISAEQAEPVEQGSDAVFDTVTEEFVDATDESTAAVSAPMPDSVATGIIPNDLDPELMEVFLYEASEILDGSDVTLQRWSMKPESEELLSDLRREMHTLKGSSRMTGLAVIGDLAHAMETLLDGIGKGEIGASPESMDLLQRALDTVNDMVTRVKNGSEVFPAEDLISELNGLKSSPPESTGQIIGIGKEQFRSVAEGGSGADAQSTLQPLSTTPERIDEEIAQAAEPDRELVDVFLDEAHEILNGSEFTLQRWSTDPANQELLNDLRRDVHTIKGSSRMAGLTVIGDLAHVIESLLEAIGRHKLEPTSSSNDLLQRGFDTLNDMLSQVKGGDQVTPVDDLINEFHVLLGLEPIQPELPVASMKPALRPAPGDVQGVKGAGRSLPSRAGADTIRVNAGLMNTLINQMGESSIYRARVDQGVGGFRFNLNELDQTVNRLRQQLRRLEIETEAQILFRYEEAPKNGHVDEFDPLELDRFSELQQLSRQLMEVVEDLSNIQNSLEDQAHNMSFLLDQQAKVNKEVQQGLMQTRMVRFSSIVPRLRRLVRQVSQDVNKKAELIISGSESEVDRSVLDNMVAPLEHMLRNAIFHGIEPPAQRLAANKPETGKITLDLRREGAELVLTLSDDGAGLNLQAIRRKAEEMGLVEPGEETDKNELISLIFVQGVTAAEKVSMVAGRGVGMDILNDAIKAMRGNVKPSTEEGKGTTFTIRLPFSLAVTQALLVQAGQDTYAVPLLSIEAVTRLAGEELQTYLSGKVVHHNYNQHRYPMHSLGVLFGNKDAVRSYESPGEVKPPALLFRSAEASAALQVDAVLGNQEIIVKPVGPQLHTVPGISGATVLGDGRVVVVLELAALVRSLTSQAQKKAEAQALRAARRGTEQEHITAMVIDDSITMRKVMARFLERHGIRVTVAKDGVEAIALLEEQVPSLAFLDIEMPRMDGFEVMGHIRNQPHLRHLPVIMVTSRSGEKHRERGTRLGVNDYLIKPYQEEEMLRSIRRVLAEQGLELPA